MNEKPMYQPWNEDEFLADEGVRKMDKYARWMYRTLLQSSFFCSTRPYLPSDDDQLWVLSGCDSLKMWQKHKKFVLPMFTEVEVRGVKLLYRKRVLKDWKRKEKIRVRNKENAEKRWNATAMRPQCDRIPVNMQVKLREVKISEVKKREDKQSDETDFPPSEDDVRKDKFRVLVKKANMVPDHDNDKQTWRDLKDTCEAFNSEVVLDEFEKWLREQEVSISRPIQQFLKDFPGRVTSSGFETKEGLDELVELLYSIGGQPFSGRDKSRLASLRNEYSDKEIAKAWRVFIEGESASSPSYWAKKFSEGAGKAILSLNRKEEKRLEEAEKLVNEEIERKRAETAARIARIEAEEAQESTSGRVTFGDPIE